MMNLEFLETVNLTALAAAFWRHLMEPKVFPHNLELEKQILSSCLGMDDAAYDLIKPGHFYATPHQHLFEAMQGLNSRKEPVEVPLILGEYRTIGKPAKPMLISELLEYPPSADIETSCQKLIGYYRLRETISVCHAATKRSLSGGPDDSSSISAYLRSQLERIDDGAGSQWVRLSDVVTECIDRAEDLRQHGGITGVPSGFRDLDWYTCGFQGGDLIILAARPGMGKTAFALNAIGHAAEMGNRSGFLSLEMARQQVGNRFLSMRSSINALKFRSGRFIPEDWTKMTDAAGAMHQWGVWIDDHPRAHYKDVHRKAREVINRHGAQALWIDYLGFLDGEKDHGKVEEVQSITRALKQTAKEFNIPIVLICQLSRKCEDRPNKRPILSDLRDSGAIEQDADCVLFLYRDDYYKQDSKDKGIVEVSISKQRNGPTGTVKLLWQDEFTRFQDLAREA